jgi:hypothetical protein
MANWYGTARSNYFRVKDEAAFQAWAKLRGLEVLTKSAGDGEEPLYALVSNSDDGAWPTVEFAEDSFEPIEINFSAEIASHLVDGEIAILMEAGSEKTRYISGSASAVNSTGEEVFISLDDIYEMAAKTFRVPATKISTC